MSYKILFVLNAVVAVALGLAFLIVPDPALKQFGMDTYAATILSTRFFGTALLTVGLVLWFAKDVSEESTQKNLGMALLIGSVLGLIVNIIGVAGGVIRTNGWITIVVYVLFALGYAFMLFLQPRMK